MNASVALTGANITFLDDPAQLSPANALSSTRQLLISRQVIEPSARGYVMFSIPFLREFLVGNRATLLARYGIAE